MARSASSVKRAVSSVRRQEAEWVRADGLSRHPWLVHAFSTRRQSGHPDFNLGYAVAEDPQAVSRNRRQLLRQLSAERLQLVTLRQRHTDIIRVIDSLPGRCKREPDGALKLAGDALVTDRPGLLLAVQVADCLPVLLVDPKRRAVAAVHAGWRGTLKRIAEKTVGKMQQEFGTNPKDLRAAFGPGIRACCYEVGREVLEAFEGSFAYGAAMFTRIEPSPSEVHWQQPLLASDRECRPRPGVTAPPAEKLFLDLVAANRRQLQAAGVPARNIWASPLCTACRTDLLFSHRAEQGRTGRMMGLVGLVERKSE